MRRGKPDRMLRRCRRRRRATCTIQRMRVASHRTRRNTRDRSWRHARRGRGARRGHARILSGRHGCGALRQGSCGGRQGRRVGACICAHQRSRTMVRDQRRERCLRACVAPCIDAACCLHACCRDWVAAVATIGCHARCLAAFGSAEGCGYHIQAKAEGVWPGGRVPRCGRARRMKCWDGGRNGSGAASAGVGCRCAASARTSHTDAACRARSELHQRVLPLHTSRRNTHGLAAEQDAARRILQAAAVHG